MGSRTVVRDGRLQDFLDALRRCSRRDPLPIHCLTSLACDVRRQGIDNEDASESFGTEERRLRRKITVACLHFLPAQTQSRREW